MVFRRNYGQVCQGGSQFETFAELEEAMGQQSDKVGGGPLVKEDESGDC